MKHLRLLVALLALLTGVGNLCAQTDVTDQYITNASFEYSAEGTQSSAQALTNGGHTMDGNFPTSEHPL